MNNIVREIYVNLLLKRYYVSFRENDCGRGAFLALSHESNEKPIINFYYYIFSKDGIIEKYISDNERERNEDILL